MASQRIAVIGSGIAGLSAAWLLSKRHDVTLFERQGRLGGHTNTVSADTPDGPVPVDTGFIVYNEMNYPNLKALFDHLKVPTAPSRMSFAVSLDRGRLEYSGEKLLGLFGQPRNLVRRDHWRLVQDILRFFRSAERDIKDCPPDLTIGDFLDRKGYSRAFVRDHILPVSAAIWSTPSAAMLDFPARTFISFFANHGLLKISGRPQWRTVLGGSQEYVSRLVADSRMTTRVSANLASVLRFPDRVEVIDADGQRERFDEVVLACHADDAQALLADPSQAERETLSNFRFARNRAVLHTDRRLMPRRRHLWCSWNYLRDGDAESDLSVTYWMNSLQPLETRSNVFVTVNPTHDIAPEHVIYETEYAHPLFDARAIDAQRRVPRVQGVNRTWFAGAWLGYGFHEDGLQAGLEVAERIGVENRPWTVPDARGRIAHGWSDGEPTLWAAE